MDIIQATAIATQIMDGAKHDCPTPDYVTVSTTGTIGFQMRTFTEVGSWAEYLNAEFEYDEKETEIIGKPGQIGNVGFANVRRTYTDPDHGDVFIHVYHNEVLQSDPQAEALFPLPEAT